MKIDKQLELIEKSKKCLCGKEGVFIPHIGCDINKFNYANKLNRQYCKDCWDKEIIK